MPESIPVGVDVGTHDEIGTTLLLAVVGTNTGRLRSLTAG